MEQNHQTFVNIPLPTRSSLWVWRCSLPWWRRRMSCAGFQSCKRGTAWFGGWEYLRFYIACLQTPKLRSTVKKPMWVMGDHCIKHVLVYFHMNGLISVEELCFYATHTHHRLHWIAELKQNFLLCWCVCSCRLGIPPLRSQAGVIPAHSSIHCFMPQGHVQVWPSHCQVKLLVRMWSLS